MKETLEAIEKTANGEDDPGYSWFVETILDFVKHVRNLERENGRLIAEVEDLKAEAIQRKEID